MAEDTMQWVSELLDDEVDSNEVAEKLRWLSVNREASAAWQSYNLISDALKQNLPAEVDLDLTARVSAALERDTDIAAADPHVDEVSPKHKIWGIGLAASVAVVTVVGALALVSTPASNSGGQQIAQKTIAQQQAATVAVQSPPLVEESQRARLADSYLVNHNEYAAKARVNGIMPYARLVSQGQE